VKRDDPVLWIGLGVGIAVIGFLLIDIYNPQIGIMWVIMRGEIGDVPYRYVLAVAVCLILYGGYLKAKK
jgi:hypothetical protein